MMLESHKVNMSTENENPAKLQAIVATKVTKCFGEGEAKVPAGRAHVLSGGRGQSLFAEDSCAGIATTGRGGGIVRTLSEHRNEPLQVRHRQLLECDHRAGGAVK